MRRTYSQNKDKLHSCQDISFRRNPSRVPGNPTVLRSFTVSVLKQLPVFKRASIKECRRAAPSFMAYELFCNLMIKSFEVLFQARMCRIFAKCAGFLQRKPDAQNMSMIIRECSEYERDFWRVSPQNREVRGDKPTRKGGGWARAGLGGDDGSGGGVVSGGLFRGKRGSSSDGACARLSSVDGLRGWMRFVPRMCGAE